MKILQKMYSMKLKDQLKNGNMNMNSMNLLLNFQSLIINQKEDIKKYLTEPIIPKISLKQLKNLINKEYGISMKYKKKKNVYGGNIVSTN